MARAASLVSIRGFRVGSGKFKSTVFAVAMVSSPLLRVVGLLRQIRWRGFLDRKRRPDLVGSVMGGLFALADELTQPSRLHVVEEIRQKKIARQDTANGDLDIDLEAGTVRLLSPNTDSH